jgi:hypothetical protein
MHSRRAFASDEWIVARKNGWVVLISAAKPGSFEVLLERGCGRAFSGIFAEQARDDEERS